MALFDWNVDGKNDIFDTAIEYEIFKSVFEDDDENNIDDTDFEIDD